MLDFRILNTSDEDVAFIDLQDNLVPGETRLISTARVPVRDLLNLRRVGVLDIIEIERSVGGIPVSQYFEEPDVRVMNLSTSEILFSLSLIGGVLKLAAGETKILSTYEIPLEDVTSLAKAGLISIVDYPSSVGGVALPPLDNVGGSTVEKKIFRVSGDIAVETEVVLPSSMTYMRSMGLQSSGLSGQYLDVYYNGILLQADSSDQGNDYEEFSNSSVKFHHLSLTEGDRLTFISKS